MNNNDRLLRLRYAIDLKDTDLIKAFELGGVPLTKEEAQAVLTKVQDKNKDNAENNVSAWTVISPSDNFPLPIWTAVLKLNL